MPHFRPGRKGAVGESTNSWRTIDVSQPLPAARHGFMANRSQCFDSTMPGAIITARRFARRQCAAYEKVGDVDDEGDNTSRHSTLRR